MSDLYLHGTHCPGLHFVILYQQTERRLELPRSS